ncbi:MAG: alpha/beta hydrolase [Phycisphaera sp.]|nr:alpha/beta hydrolase [Phycisphaera sp.]
MMERRSSSVLASVGLAIAFATPVHASPCPAIADDPPIVEAVATPSLPAGRWVAEVPVEPFPRPVLIQLEIDGSTQPSSITASIPVLGMFSGTPSRREVVEDAVRLDFSAAGITCQLDLRKAAPGRIDGVLRFKGDAVQEMQGVDHAFVLREVPDLLRIAEVERHEAVLQLPGGARLPFSILLGKVDGAIVAEMDIPAQGVNRIVMFTDPEATATLAESRPGSIVFRVGMPVPVSLAISPVDGSWEGTFTQGPAELPVTFSRAEGPAVVGDFRPQEPKPPFPYEVVEVVMPSPKGHELHGTLTIPRETGERGVPGVVLVSGSGPQDRDETVLGHRPFLVLADRLTRAGIACLRFDDRGVGKSTGDFAGAVTHDFADDAATALAFLSEATGVDETRCGLAGHSEGGAVIALVGSGQAATAPDAKPAFLVSIAGCGVDGGLVLEDQLPRIYRASSMDEAVIETISRAQKRLVTVVRGEPIDEVALLEAIRGLHSAQEKLQPEPFTDDIRARLEEAAMAQMTSPWMTTFIRFDPATAWRGVEVPVLAINGTLDTQVAADINLPAIEEAVRAGGGSIEIVRLEGLNHMLQPATTGGPDEYGAIKTTMDEAAMAIIADFILEAPARRPASDGPKGDA